MIFNRARAWLAHQTDRLAAAERLSFRPDLAAKLEPTDHDYIAACREAETAAKRGKRLLQIATYALGALVILVLSAVIEQAHIIGGYRYLRFTLPYAYAQGRPLKAATEQALKPGDSLNECVQDCPEMLVVPAGSFLMGSPATEKGRNASETPQHLVRIAKPLAVSKLEVTFADWDACVTGGGCDDYEPAAEWGRDDPDYRRMPVFNVSWDDAQQYVAWLSVVTGKP